MTKSFPKIVWMYWENKLFSKKPAYLQLCCETIKKHLGDYELNLLNNQSVKQYLDIPEKVFKFKHIAHRADYIRFHLLHEYGGVWLDADTILLRPINEAVEPFIEEFDYVGYGREYGKPSINFMAAWKGCPLLRKHIEQMDFIIQNKRPSLINRKIEIVWTEIGHDILWPLAEKYNYYHHERKMLAPVYWRDWEDFLKPPSDIEALLSHKPYAVVLYNDFLFSKLKNVDRNSILENNILLSHFTRMGLAEF